eukprot:TRINITY_DN2439_c0_g1_i1.p2 TRINITY_DN2439_c0_g1~~TRINITY_DN2439_c0_g1_i1.p2  ORF type:complete len:208 (-),score=53.42 TRINITY_DN2439_c0_g1_i1:125-727(-)
MNIAPSVFALTLALVCCAAAQSAPWQLPPVSVISMRVSFEEQQIAVNWWANWTASPMLERFDYLASMEGGVLRPDTASFASSAQSDGWNPPGTTCQWRRSLVAHICNSTFSPPCSCSSDMVWIPQSPAGNNPTPGPVTSFHGRRCQTWKGDNGVIFLSDAVTGAPCGAIAGYGTNDFTEYVFESVGTSFDRNNLDADCTK